MLQICKSVCKCTHYCLAHKLTTNEHYRNHELVEGEPELLEECPMFWDAREEGENE